MAGTGVPPPAVAALLARLDGIRASGGGWTARCPSHEDTHNSLKVDTGTDGRVMTHCYAGCTPEQVVGSLGLTMADLFEPDDKPPPKPAGPPRTVTYPIRNLAGDIVAIHERIETGSSKRFIWKLPGGGTGLKGIGVAELPLYGTERLSRWDAQQPIVITEGEKAASALLRAKIPALGTITGAASTPSDAALEPLYDHTLILWPDNDKPGFDHMQRLADRLQDHATIKTARWAEAPTHGDASDYLNLHSTDETRSLLAAASDGPPNRPQPPVYEVQQGVYVVDYPSQGVRLEFDYIQMERSDLWAELSVLVRNGSPTAKTMMRTRVNLLKGLTRRDAARDLVTRTNGLSIDWADVLEQASQWVVDRHRAGAAALVLREVADPVITSAYIPPLLIPEGSTMLFGKGGSLKSYTALALGISLHTGLEIIEGMPPAAQLRVGFCDWEWNEHIHARRMRRLLNGREEPDLVYIRARDSLPEERDRLRHIIREHRLDYLIIDSVGKAAGDDPEAAHTANQFYNVLDQLEVGCLLIAHVSKDAIQRGTADAAYGSIYWMNGARSAWYLKLREGLGDDSRSTLGLYHKKSNEGRRQQPFAIDFWTDDGDDGPIHMRRADIRNDVELSRSLPLRIRVIELLKGGAMTQYEIADALEVDGDAVRMALKRSENKDFVKIVRSSDGIYVWGLTAQ